MKQAPKPPSPVKPVETFEADLLVQDMTTILSLCQGQEKTHRQTSQTGHLYQLTIAFNVTLKCLHDRSDRKVTIIESRGDINATKGTQE